MTLREKAESRLAGEFVPGERVLHALIAFRAGGVRKTMVAGAAGIAGFAGAAGMALAARRGQAEAPQVPISTPGRFLFALTSHRIALFTVGGIVRAAPGKPLQSWLLDQLAWVSEPELNSGVAQALRGRIGVVGEGVLGFEFARLQADEGRSMIKRLARVVKELETGTAF
ncbi:hypothetical protein F9C11_31550 [Amycolatopsis sp. VS8301801F10]|uniref:hypothetical protein n=1 Tax=Amycolatopsis sp. VS8301801F10 TaxID=2652442 RepID=UPI0038FC97E8